MSGYGVVGPANGREICAITAGPALAMVLGSAAASMGQPTEQLQARLQHLSAGLLVGAVITEIFPILKERLTGCGLGVCWFDLLTAVVGFGSALVFMYSIKSLDLGDSSNEEQHNADTAAGEGQRVRRTSGYFLTGEMSPRRRKEMNVERIRLRQVFSRLQVHSDALLRLVDSDEVNNDKVDEEIHGIDFLVDSARRLCRGAEPFDNISLARLRGYTTQLLEDVGKIKNTDVNELQAIEKQLHIAEATLRKVHLHTERATFRRWAPKTKEVSKEPEVANMDNKAQAVTAVATSAPLPRSLIIAVVVDSIIDGMLIGLAGSVVWTSGLLMASATAIEMGFLGYSFACSLAKVMRRRFEVTLVLGLPPLAMLMASVAAAEGANFLEHTPAFCGLVAFALVAVLFLVLQELLIEAHEKEDGQAWHITLWLYVGLLLSISLDVIV